MGREERKVVTILFTDLVGFTSRAEELDPEDVRALLSPYYARLREQIEQRGGTVEKFIGDAVMAVFGAPVAHEDDPVRAVLTAIAIRDGSPDIEIRTAVNTGEALVALEADVSAGEGFVSGDVVNTAARLQSAAPVNGILVGDATHRATRHVIDYRDAEPVEAKGKSRPIPVWEVVAARPRYGTDVEETHLSVLVGRDRELAVLTDAFARSRGEETAQLVTLVGVPGIGKSRLVAELFSVLDADPNVYWWRQGRSLPYGESRSVWALGEIVKAQAGILESDDARTAEQKLAAMVDELLPDEEERRWVASHLRTLAGVAGVLDESADRRVEAFAAWRRFFEALAEQRPLVVVFEDLHWADDTLLDFVDHLAEWVSGVPMLVVCTARPELLDRRPGWGGGKRNATTLSIGALSDDETALLLHRLIDQSVLDADTQQVVLRRAQGNPLYAGEYARMLADHGGGDLPLPETVQGLIAARIDALTAEEKALVQDASVLGKVFWPSALESAGEAALHALERKEFIRRDRRSAVGGETQYAFLHLLVRDVAYGQIPRARRMDKHRAAADWIASLSPDRSDDRAEMLAHHYREALALAEAAGVDTAGLRAPALSALVEASERAAALSSWATARDLAAEALVLTEDGDPRRPELHLRLARAKAYAFGEWDFALAEAARDWYVARSEIAQAAESEAFLSWMHWWRADGTKAREHAQLALDLAADLPTSLSKARAYAQAARLHGIGGDPRHAIALADETLAMALELGRDDIQSSALNSRGIAKGKVDDMTCLDDLERSIVLADRSNSPHEISTSRNNYGSVLSGLGRVAEADAIWEENVGASLQHGYPAGAQWSEMALIVHRIPAGDVDRLVEMLEDMHPRVTPGTQPENALQVVRSWVLATRGDTDGAIRLLKKARAFALQIRDAQAVAPVLAAQAFAFFVAGRHDEADAAIDEFLTTPAHLGMLGSTSDLLLTLIERGRIDEWVAAIGDSFPESEWVKAGMAAAAGEMVRAAEIYHAMGAHFLEAWARLIAAERGDLSQLEPARAFFAAQGAAPFVRRCETTLSASA
jgi:class 3 adenylate cyclase